MNHDAGRAERLGCVISGVVRQAVSDAGARGILLLDADTPEGSLAAAWCRAALSADQVFTAPADALGGSEPAPHLLRAHPASKTALLLAEPPLVELLPLGDLYASEVAALAGSWSAPEEVQELARSLGDVALLDGVLRRWAEGRTPLEQVLGGLDEAVAGRLRAVLAGRRWQRWRMGLIPKLGGRTLGVDFWE